MSTADFYAAAGKCANCRNQKKEIHVLKHEITQHISPRQRVVLEYDKRHSDRVAT